MDKDLTIIYGIWITALAVVLALPLITASPGPGDWWNESYEERYPHNDNNSGYTGIGYFGANVSGWYGIINNSGQVYTYNDTDNGLVVANNTDELCWFDTANDVSNCPSQTGSASNLVTYWSLDRGSGNVEDYISNKDGIPYGSISRGVTGKVNNAFDFDGTDDYVDIPNDFGIFDGSQAFSFSVWFNADSLSNKQKILNFEGERLLYLGFGQDTNNDILSIKLKESGNWEMIMQTSALSTNTWYHAVAVYDVSNGWELYLDGSSVDSIAGQDSINSVTEDSQIGRHPAGVEYFNGTIDDVRIYDTALTSTEVENQYNSTSTQFPYLEGAESQGRTFNGTVKDPSGNAISGARIVIEEAETDEFISNTSSDASGLWEITGVLEGNYTIYAYEPGNNSRAGDIKPYVECIP